MLYKRRGEGDIMNIKLPKTFYYSPNGEDYAYVNKGVLYIYGKVGFEALMYNLTYAIHGYQRCKYCGGRLTLEERTLDHIYPRSWGGISIPNNLLPCCKECNQSKADLTPRQFKRWRNIQDEMERKRYYRRCHKDNVKYVQKGKFILPREWLTQYDISELIKKINFDFLEQFKIEKVKECYNRNHQFSHPIVLSSDGTLLKGTHNVYLAKQLNIMEVPAIVLDNVVVIPKKPAEGAP